MVLNHVQPVPVKGEYSLEAEAWGQQNAYHHPLHGLAPRRHAQPRLRTQRQTSPRIEQEEHYIAIVRGKDGRDHFRSSASFRHVKSAILSKIVRDFDEVVQQQDDTDYQDERPWASLRNHPIDRSQARSSDDYQEQDPLREQNDSLMAVDPDTGSVSFPIRRKRARANTESGSIQRSTDRGSKNARVRAGQDGANKIITFQLQDEDGLKKWYSDAFDAVQQVTCRTIAKLWIKKIEPKKQSAHPYNGGLPKEDPKDPERTKPAYWPSNIPHKEPDHIQKEQRIILLTHLIINTPHQQLGPKDKMGDMIGAAELQAQSAERKNDFPADKWEILQHIFRVRQLQEDYLGGGQDGTTVVYLPDCSKATRLQQGEPERDVEDVDADIPLSVPASEDDSEETEHAGHALLTPASSTMTSPADQQRIQGHGINNPSSSFSTQDGDVKRHQMGPYDEAFERSMASAMMERRHTNDMTYAHHALVQPDYSPLPISQPQFPQQSVHLPINRGTPRWADFVQDAFNRVPHMGPPVQPEPVITGYGVFSNADMGSLATLSSGVTCNEEYFQSQANHPRMEQLGQRLPQQDLITGLTSQPPRDIPYRSTSAQSNQQMNMTSHNSYDHGMLQNPFYQHM